MGSKLQSLCPKPKLEKDKGFSWVVLFMAFFSHTLNIGFGFSVVGNLTIAQQQHFGISLEQSSLISSLFTGLFMMFAPISSVLLKATSCRITEIIGGTCLILGLGLSSLSTQPWHAFLLFSFLSAFGISCSYISSSEILAHHFSKYKYQAFSIVILGYHLGLTIFPSLTQVLLNNYGYSKTMGILSVFHVIHFIAGICFVEPDRNEPGSNQPNGNVSGVDGDEKLDYEGHDNPAMNRSESDLEETNEIEGESESNDKKNDEKEVDGVTKSLSLKDIVVMLLKSPKVWARISSSFFWNITVVSFLILVNEFMLQQTDMTGKEVSLGMSIIGIMHVVGCIGITLVSRFEFDRLILHTCSILTYSLITICMAFTNGKAMFYALGTIWGVASGAALANYLACVYDLCGAEQLGVLLSIELLFQGMGAIVSAPLCEFIAQKTEKKYGIISSGLFGLVAVLCVVPLIVDKRIKMHSEKKMASKEELPEENEA